MTKRLALATLICLILAYSFVVPSSGLCQEREFWKPMEFAEMDFTNPDSRWSFERSRQSEHCIVLWETGFGADPNAESVPEELRVDVDDLLEKSEHIYSIYVNQLGFGARKGQKSGLDKYRLEIWLLYTKDWVATGAGYDDVIGALWVSPSTCHPVGSTIAHELGHSFQYQIYCDQRLNSGAEPGQSGFRYACEDGFGCTFWEQCAEWQAGMVYPENAFTWYYKEQWSKHCHRAFENEWFRYQSYWLLYAVRALRGDEAVARVWKESRRPEDFLGAYCRIFCDGNVSRMNDDLWHYASHALTYDFPGVPTPDDEWLDLFRPEMYQAENGFMQIGYASCPDEGGFNAVPLNPKDFDGHVAIEFRELPQGAPLAELDPGVWRKGGDGVEEGGKTRRYNKPSTARRADHRYGFVALCEDGKRVYGEMNSGAEKTVEFNIPKNATRLWFVVACAAKDHRPHKWDEDESNDAQFPWEIKVLSRE